MLLCNIYGNTHLCIRQYYCLYDLGVWLGYKATHTRHHYLTGNLLLCNIFGNTRVYTAILLPKLLPKWRGYTAIHTRHQYLTGNMLFGNIYGNTHLCIRQYYCHYDLGIRQYTHDTFVWQATCFTWQYIRRNALVYTAILLPIPLPIWRIRPYTHDTIVWQGQHIPLGVTFSKALSQLKAQSSNVSFHWNVAKETVELWVLSFEAAFENVTLNGMGCSMLQGCRVRAY